MELPAITTRFSEVVNADPVRLDLAAALIAAHASPGLVADEVVERLDELADQVETPTVEGLLDWYRAAGFDGDRTTYGDPRNSYLDQVLDRRSGIPITLAVVLIEVARRRGVPLAGVSMPGHFLVRDLDDGTRLIDAFDGGRLLGEADARDLHARIHGPDEGFHPSFLAPVDHLHILTRMLTNLRLAFTRTQSLRDLTWVLRLRTTLPTVDPDERRALASVLATQGQYLAAADLLDDLAERTDGAREAKFRTEANQLRAKLN
ncbi:MAG: transglutaminase-like domain-containing protein [Actinomycetota bacterium]